MGKHLLSVSTAVKRPSFLQTFPKPAKHVVQPYQDMDKEPGLHKQVIQYYDRLLKLRHKKKDPLQVGNRPLCARNLLLCKLVLRLVKKDFQQAVPLECQVVRVMQKVAGGKAKQLVLCLLYASWQLVLRRRTVKHQ